MITTSFPGIVRAVGMFFILSILADRIYFILSAGTSKEGSEKPPINPIRLKRLFSEALNDVKENSVCNPYRFKNVIELTAQALGFIFFIDPRRYHHHSSTLRRNVTARENVYAEIAFQKPTTCL